MADDGQRTRDVDGRRQRILDFLQRETSAQVIELAERFGVSRMTVHRDLDALSEQGFIRKVHGGARARSLKLVETDFAQRCTVALAEKRAIVRTAAALVQPGQIVAIDDSSTCRMLADELAEIDGLTIITNALGILDRLHAVQHLTVIGLGGTYKPHYNGFFGMVTERAMRGLRANIVFISAQTIGEDAVFHPDELIAKNQRSFMAISDRRVLMANSQKFGATALHRVCDVAAFDAVVTDAGIDENELDRLRDAKLDVLVADPST
ncbi:DeoR/GlpR family DNA-binding transcription regulator [Rhizosaccharibacter radicis]|uniref:DeoR/GlpR family DNA-binding transcription regulator n=1 Tax=Rhizosaccharibacter radicis TaxID=2782605 RepID=A0ABT1VZ22_9PROT|nr:DeoR/GlpR family DNA-binding transcription regulator [Acetobacteraceae bacterium KSS12]